MLPLFPGLLNLRGLSFLPAIANSGEGDWKSSILLISCLPFVDMQRAESAEDGVGERDVAVF